MRGGATMLPVNFLRQLIGLYGGKMQGAVPQYLEAAMDMFQKNQGDARRGRRQLRRRNRCSPTSPSATWRCSSEAGRAFDRRRRRQSPPTSDDTQSEVDKLRAELAALQAKVDKLGK